MGLDLPCMDGQTPLDEEEREGLLIPTIATRGELDEFEQQNIEKAMQWSLGRSFKPEAFFTERFVRMLHTRMYGDVWAWAGVFRKTNKNIGIDKWQIPTALRVLLEDALYWHGHHIYSPVELAVRFKHRLVSIHCFPNGNGRHSRLMADLLIGNMYRQPVFTWGAAHGSTDVDPRTAYLQAIKAADNGDYGPLLAFVRS